MLQYYPQVLKMGQIQQVVYILLYLQFFICNVFTFNIDILSKEDTNDTIDLMWFNEWKCSFNDDCTAKDSECIDQLCQCAPDYIFNANLTACVKVATRLCDTCEETVQCSAYLLSGAKCEKNVCVCGPGYYYLHGRCNQYFGLREKCESNIDCYVNADFEASICDNGICKCSPGFYQREYRTCRREGKAVGDECTVDIDCTFDNAICNNFVCSIKSKADDATELSSYVTLTKRALDKRTRVGGNCTTDEDCKEMGNAICGPTKTCRCDRAHFASDTDTVCIPELGEPCENNDTSYIPRSICREGMSLWSCTNGTVASKDNRECLNATREYMGYCHLDEQCYIFGPDAICIDSKCICNEDISHYVESELFCWGNTGVGENCTQDRDCYVKDFNGSLICNDMRTCGCPDGTRLSKDNMTCIKPSGLGESCEIGIDCKIPYSDCEEEMCTCIENYYESDQFCLPGINATCTHNKGCAPENSICISKICSCKQNYVAVTIDSCMPVSQFGEPCQLDLQCSAVTSRAICATVENDTAENNTVCTCSKEDHYRFERCFKKKLIGETCTNLGECYESYKDQQRIVCKNEKCACTWGYIKSNDSVCVNNPKGSKFFLPGGATNVVSTGLLSIISFILSSKLL